MPKPLFRVKPYSHGKYKFVVRAKVLGKWKRRYFETEAEAIAFSEQQNATAKHGNGDGSTNGTRKAPELTASRLAERPQSQRSGPARDFSSLLSPDYLGPKIERYIGDSWCMHLPFAYDLMLELAPKVFVELGVKEGESYFSFCQSAAENKISVRCYGIDSWQGDVQTGNLNPEIQREAMEYNWRYSSFSELKKMLFAEALADFPDASIDLLHIDGTHTYGEVKSDFESWLPKLSANGIILFHDVIPRDGGFGVWKVWEEIAREDNSFLFEFGFGLGVWKKQPVAPSDSFFVRRLLGANKTERRDINEYYAHAAGALSLWESLRKQSGADNEVARFKTEAEEKTQQVLHLEREAEEKAQQAAQLKAEAKERTQQAVQLKAEVKERTQRVVDLEREAEEKSNHVLLLQADLEKRSQRAAQLKAETEEKSRQITQLQRELEEKSKQVTQFKTETEERSRHGAQLARAQNELLDARWEALTLRGTLLRKSDSAETPFSRILDLENRVETTASERDHLRTMLVSLQNDLERERLAARGRQDELRAAQDELDAARAQLKAVTKDLRSEQKQMDRVRSSTRRKLILPFGKSQRKLQQLTASRRGDD
jgi:hypothetical protein